MTQAAKVDADVVELAGGVFVGPQSIKALGGRLSGEGLAIPHNGGVLHYQRSRINGIAIIREGRAVFDFLRIARG